MIAKTGESVLMTTRTSIRLFRLLFFALCCLQLSASPAFPANKSGGKEQWTAASMGIPAKNAPWQLMTQIGDTFVMLNIPADLQAVRHYPDPVKRAIRRRIEFRNGNVDILSHLASGVEQLLKKHTFRRVPQRERVMDEIVIAVDPADVKDGNPLYKHEPILLNLPPYTLIHVFAPDFLVDAVRSQLKSLQLKNKVKVHAESLWLVEEDGIELSHGIIPWTQDIFRVAVDEGGTEYLFAPAAYLQSADLSRPDLDYVQHLAGGRKSRRVVSLPIFFRAGNFAAGETQRKMLFIGDRALKFNSVNFFNAAQVKPSDESFIALLKATSGADDAYVLPNSSSLFHLDMAMAVIDTGVVALIEPLDKDHVGSEDGSALAEIKKTLTSLGFRIVFIPTLAKRIKAFQSPVNIVPFVNRLDKKRYALIPEYPDVSVSVNGQKRSLNRMIRDAYQKSGIQVIWVEDRFSGKCGNIHCALKVIN